MLYKLLFFDIIGGWLCRGELTRSCFRKRFSVIYSVLASIFRCLQLCTRGPNNTNHNEW